MQSPTTCNGHISTPACQANPDTPDLSEKLAEKEQELERTRQQLQRYAPAEQIVSELPQHPIHAIILPHPAVLIDPVLDA